MSKVMKQVSVDRIWTHHIQMEQSTSIQVLKDKHIVWIQDGYYVLFGKSSLPFRQSGRSADFASSVFCGFFIFRIQNPLLYGLRSVTALQKCYSRIPCVIRVVTFVTFVTPYLKKIFKNTKGKKNIIGRCILAEMFLAHLACAHIINKFLNII